MWLCTTQRTQARNGQLMMSYAHTFVELIAQHITGTWDWYPGKEFLTHWPSVGHWEDDNSEPILAENCCLPTISHASMWNSYIHVLCTCTPTHTCNVLHCSPQQTSQRTTEQWPTLTALGFSRLSKLHVNSFHNLDYKTCSHGTASSKIVLNFWKIF